ncbi:hypothetical protein [Methanosarcina sp. UBA5]|uniref:hypothetical protein n=1 Tax=Methanosarcina sp. UBA5 TaxID=1915593 RepID=UPI0025ECE265|nr:hypothetical protein [Methanosarcina sp. UBA5]
MKGEIVDGTRSSALDLNENIVEEVWRELDDELTVEIFWEALDLTGFYILLRTMYHVLLAVEYVSLEVRTSPLNMIEQKIAQNENDLLEEGKSRLWQIFNKYHISGTGIKMRRQLRTENKKDTELSGNFVIESNSTLTHPMFPDITETITSLYCC